MTSIKPLAPRAIVRNVLAAFLGMYADQTGELCCFEIQEMLVSHGMLVRTYATADDCEQSWAIEDDIEVGDRILRYSPLMQELLSHDQG